MLERQKVLMVVAHDIFRDEEYAEPRSVLEGAGVSVAVASSKPGPATGKFGLEVEPDLLLKDAKPDDYDAVIFVGGAGSREYFEEPAALALAKDMDRLGKVVAAICIAPQILANAGLLKGKKATVFESQIGGIKEGGAVFTDCDVQTDGRIITARGPEAARDFGEEVIDALQRL